MVTPFALLVYYMYADARCRLSISTVQSCKARPYSVSCRAIPSNRVDALLDLLDCSGLQPDREHAKDSS